MSLRSILVFLFSTLAIATASATEEVQVGSIHMSLTEDCLMTFTNSQNLQTQWQFPSEGVCYFSKSRGGKDIQIYQHVKNNALEAPRLVLVHSSKRINKRKCDTQEVAIMVREGKVLVSLPPYAKFTKCITPNSGVDQKNFSYHWFYFDDETKYMELPFK